MRRDPSGGVPGPFPDEPFPDGPFPDEPFPDEPFPDEPLPPGAMGTSSAVEPEPAIVTGCRFTTAMPPTTATAVTAAAAIAPEAYLVLMAQSKLPPVRRALSTSHEMPGSRGRTDPIRAVPLQSGECCPSN
jgi:hypothetical protein